MGARRRGIIFTILGVLLALFTALLVSSYVGSLEREIGERVEVLVAATDIDPHTLLKPDMVAFKEFPRKYLEQVPAAIQRRLNADGTPASVTQVLGARLRVTQVKLPRGTIIQEEMVQPPLLEKAMRAVTLAVNQETSVGGSITPGSFVDIVASLGGTSAPGLGTPTPNTTLLLLERVPVLAVGSVGAGGQGGLGVLGGGLLPTGELPKSNTITLALRPEEVLQVIYMANFAKELRFILRRADDTELKRLPPVTLESLGRR